MLSKPKRWSQPESGPANTQQNNYQPAVNRQASAHDGNASAPAQSPARNEATPVREPLQYHNEPAQQPQRAAATPDKNGGTHEHREPIRMVEPKATAPAADNDSFISPKITKINGRDKVIDFNSYLSMATVNDYAMVHGCGGSDHARNSTIGVTLCDYTKGKGDKSITVKYSIDVADIAILLHAAMKARMGDFVKPPSMPTGMADNLISQISSWQSCPVTPDGSRVIPRDSLNMLMRDATNLRNTMAAPSGNTPLFSYTREKNNPYKKKNGMVPVSAITISFSPTDQRGNPSNYPWYVRIDNFDAPLTEKGNGATAHKSSQATNKKSAFINLSMDDFAAAMVAVDSHIRLWEHRTLAVMDEAFRRIEQRDAKKQYAANGR